MSNRRFLFLSYACCVALALGSLTPWATGYLDSAGIARFGIATLVGAGATAGLIWHWSTSGKESSLLIGATIVLLCLAVLLYAVYADVYDPYAAAGDTWINYIGWGLVLAVLGAFGLVVLFVRQYWLVRSGRSPFSWPRLVLIAGVIPAMAMTLWVGVAIISNSSASESFPLPEASSDRPIPRHALKVASGRNDGVRWGIWLYGNSAKENCVGTTAKVDRIAAREGTATNVEETYCEVGVPPKHFRQMIEVPLEKSDGARAAIFFVTRRDVGSLAVMTSDDVEGEPSWLRMKAERISHRLARSARLHPNVGYVLIKLRRSQCVRRIVALDRNGGPSQVMSGTPCAMHAR